MNAWVISPKRNLIKEIVPLLEVVDRDYSGTMVVFPGRRPSHFLRKALAEKVGGCFVPPAVVSMDEFIDRVYNHVNSDIHISSGRKLEAIDAVSILYDIHRSAVDPLGGKGFMTLDSFFPIGLKIYGDLEELFIEDVPVQKVKDIQPFADEAIPEQTLKRLQSLAFFYERFYQRTGQEGYSTRSMRYRTTADRLGDIREQALGKFNKIIFAGFFILTGAEKRLFRRLSELNNAFFIFQGGPGMRETLKKIGVDALLSENGFENESENFGPPPDITFYSSPDTHGQVYALGNIIDSIVTKEGGVPDEKTAIVLPTSETLFPLLRQGIAGLDESDYNVSMGYPLHRTPLFGLLNNLMELITSMQGDRYYVPDYLKFILHPYIKNIYYQGSAEVTRIMFHSLEEGLLKNSSRPFLSLPELEEDRLIEHIYGKMTGTIGKAELIGHLRSIHRNTIGMFSKFRSVGDFSEKCSALLAYIFNESTASLHPLFRPFSESFIRALDIISRSLMKDMAFAETTGYFTFFRKYVMTCHTPFEGTPVRGLQVLGLLETRNLTFDRVCILDVNEDVLPATNREETFLPFKARKVLGLSTYRDRDILAAHYFDALVAGSSSVHIFFVENDRQERSRFVERLIWDRQKAKGSYDEKGYVRTVQYDVTLTNNNPEAVAKTPEVARFLRDFTYSATSLDKYLHCPLSFYYSYVLNLDRKEEISGEIERSDIGKLVHRVLASYFSKKQGHQLRESDINTRELSSLVDSVFEKEYGGTLTGSIYLVKRQVDSHLKQLLRKYYLPLIKKNSVTIVETERNLSCVFEGFRLQGRLDSVERRNEKIMVIDYKTGSNQRNLKIDLDRIDAADRGTWAESIGSLQLPVYLKLYAEAAAADIKHLDAMYLMLGISDISSNIELKLIGDDDPHEVFTLMQEILSGLLREIADPHVPFAAATERKKTCPYCDFRFICGTQWVVK